MRRFIAEYRIRRRLAIIANHTSNTSLPVSQGLKVLFEDWFHEAATQMLTKKWSSMQALTAMVTMVAVAGEVEGQNARLKEHEPALYQDLKNLYQFLRLASVTYHPDLVDFVVRPHAGHPEPFSSPTT